MYIVKYLELVHMAEMHSQALASSAYELVPNILRYTFNNLYIFIFIFYTSALCVGTRGWGVFNLSQGFIFRTYLLFVKLFLLKDEIIHRLLF